MKQEEEDNAFLSSLGVTSANPEDIERDVLQQARSNAGENSESRRTVDHKAIDTTENSEPISSLRHVELYNKLRAVNIEIDAVASTVEQVDFVKSEDHASDEVTGKEQSSFNPWSSDPIQQALASDRLRSLRKTKTQLEEELIKCKGKSADGSDYENVIQDVVKEEPKRKRKEDPKLSDNKKKRRKAVTFGDDEDFDAVLNAASAGFVETERDELVRKGILTPFHKLKGFERRIQETGPSSKKDLPEDVDNTDDFASSSIARAARSIPQAAETLPMLQLVLFKGLEHPQEYLNLLEMRRTIDVDSSNRAGGSINNRISSDLYQESLLNLNNLQNQQKPWKKMEVLNVREC